MKVGFRYDSRSNQHDSDANTPISCSLTGLIRFAFIFNLIVTFQKAKTSLPVLLTVLCASVVK